MLGPGILVAATGVGAGDLATGLDSPEPLRAGLGQLGDACKACHTEYRE